MPLAVHAGMPQLRRSLGLPALTFFGVGIILGAGIYSIIGAAAGRAGEATWMSFVFGAVAALLTGLSYAELAAMHPRTGAEFVYVREAFPGIKGAATACGLLLTVSAATTATTVSLAFAGYLSRLVPAPGMVVAAALLATVTLINIVGIRSSTAVTVAFTIVEVAGLLMVITLAAGDDDFGQALASPPHLGVLAGAALIFFAYLGFEDIVNLAEEVRDPERAIPRAILLSLAISTTLYVLVALGAVALVTPEALAGSEAPLAEAVARWPRVASSLSIIALFATANTALATLLTASRMLHGMSREKELPEALGRVLPGRATPWIASLAVLAIALALLPAGGLEVVAGLASFGALVAFVAVNGSCIALRLRKPETKRPFRIPLAVGNVPVVPVLGLLATISLIASFDARVLVAGAMASAACVLAVAFRRAWLRRTPSA